MIAPTALALLAASLFADSALAADGVHRHAAHLRRDVHAHGHRSTTTSVLTRYLTTTVQQASPTTLLTYTRDATVINDAVAAEATEAVAARGVSGKRGVAYNDASVVSVLAGNSNKFGYAYNWDSNSNNLQSSLNYVPMLWGPIDVHTSRWNANADAMIAAGATHLLSFNEPDNSGQCNLSPAQAADAHVQYMNPYGDKALIGSPAITNSDKAGEGLDYLKTFWEQCKAKGCKIDFCVTHWYHLPSAADDLFKHIKAVSDICEGKKVWVTEFGLVQASDSDIDNFMTTVIPRLDADTNVESYFYFFAAAGHLLKDATSLSSYGQLYASV